MTNSVKKTPSALDTDELFKIAEQSLQTPETEIAPLDSNDIFTFFSTFNLEAGETPIKKNLLYSIYKAWSAYPLIKKDFIKEVDNYIPFKNGYYKINQNAVRLTYDVYKKFKQVNKKQTSKNWVRHYQDFLNFHALEQGDFWIELDIFYFLYDKYTYTRKIRALNKKEFEKFCSLYLKSKITTTGKVYGVTANVQNFFQEGQLERMKKSYVQEEKKKNKKRKHKKSRSRQEIQLKN